MTSTHDSSDLSEEQTRSLLWACEDTRPLPKQGDRVYPGDNFLILRGPLEGPRWLIRLNNVSKALFIGRHRDCDIVVDDPCCSRIHCELFKVNGEWKIVQRSSTNATRVNGHDVDEGFLYDGDVISIGGSRLTFFVDEPSLEEQRAIAAPQ